MKVITSGVTITNEKRSQITEAVQQKLPRYWNVTRVGVDTFTVTYHQPPQPYKIIARFAYVSGISTVIADVGSPSECITEMYQAVGSVLQAWDKFELALINPAYFPNQHIIIDPTKGEHDD